MASRGTGRRYFFILEGPEGMSDDDANGTALPNDAAAMEYAARIVGELKDAGGYSDPALKLIVKDSAGKVVHLISF